MPRGFSSPFTAFLPYWDSRIVQDHTQGSSMQSQALETIQDRLREADIALKREQDSYHQMQVLLTSYLTDQWGLKTLIRLGFLLQSEYNVRLSKMESERQTLAETLAAAERRGGDEKLRADDLQLQMKGAKAAAESAKQELHDYKNKASRILQVTLYYLQIYI